MSRALFTNLFAFVIFAFHNVSGMAYEIILNTFEDIEAYTFASFEKIQKKAKSIVEVPFEQQTFENILRPWNQITDELTEIINTLKPIENFQIVQDLYSGLNAEIFQNIVLQDSLKNYVRKSLNNNLLNSYQRFVLQQFLENSDLSQEGFLKLCKHKETFEIEHETDDDGSSRTKAKGSYEYEKDDYYINGEVWVERSDENGRSQTDCGAGVQGGKRF